MPPDKVEPRILHVDANEFCLGLITEKALAMVRLYRGQKQLAFPEDVKPLAGRARLGPESAAEPDLRAPSLAHHP